MSVRGDLIVGKPQQPIVSKDKNVMIHCGKVYYKTDDDINLKPIKSVKMGSIEEL